MDRTQMIDRLLQKRMSDFDFYYAFGVEANPRELSALSDRKLEDVYFELTLWEGK